MIEIYSKASHRSILHRVVSVNEADFRMDISEKTEPLQAAIHARNIGMNPKPHIHLEKVLLTNKFQTQESWFIFFGKVEATYFDLDGSFLKQVTLVAGDLSITYRGGHSFEVIENGTILVEHKNGPYNGEDDKRLI